MREQNRNELTVSSWKIGFRCKMLERMRRRTKSIQFPSCSTSARAEHFPILGFVHFICPLKRVRECNHWMDVSQAAPRDSASWLPAPRPEHISPLSGGELTGPRLIQDIVSTLLKAILSVNRLDTWFTVPSRTNYLLEPASYPYSPTKATATNRFLLYCPTPFLSRKHRLVMNLFEPPPASPLNKKEGTI